MNNNIYLAEVLDKADNTRAGVFWAKIYGHTNEEEPVYYISPYASNTEGAFIAIPEVGVEILVCKPTGSNSFYYLGATFSPEIDESSGDKITDSQINPLERADPKLNRARGIPMRLSLKGTGGQGLVISEEYNPKSFNKSVELKSMVSKKVKLSDSPGEDSIIIDSGNHSKITLTDNPKSGYFAPRSIEVESVGPQKYINRESQTDIVVGDGGRELQLINKAHGEDWGEDVLCGNVNIQSERKDVHIFTKGESGRIFIESINQDGSSQIIQIRTANGDIIITSSNNINLIAQNNISIDAVNGVFIKGSTVGIQGDTIDTNSSGETKINGSAIRLAEGASPGTTNTNIEESVYGSEGITTY